MPAKKKEVKAEEPVIVEEEGSFVHEPEGARYTGGIRRYTIPNANGADGGTASAAGAGGGGGKGGARSHSVSPKLAAQTGAPGAAATGGATSSTPPARRVRHGRGTYVSPVLRYTGDWDEDEMHGRGTLSFVASGNTYEGDFVRGKFEGTGVYRWADGSKYEGGWRDNHMHGEGVFLDVDGNVWKGKYYNGSGPGLEGLRHGVM